MSDRVLLWLYAGMFAAVCLYVAGCFIWSRWPRKADKWTPEEIERMKAQNAPPMALNLVRRAVQPTSGTNLPRSGEVE